MRFRTRISALAALLLMISAAGAGAQGYYGTGYYGGFFSGLPVMPRSYGGGGFGLNPYGAMSGLNPYAQMPLTGPTTLPVDLGSPYGYNFLGGGMMQPTQFVVYPDYGSIPQLTPDQQAALAAQATPPPTAPVAVQPVVQPVAQTVDASIGTDGKLHVKWNGDPSTIEAISFSLLDKAKKPIKITVANKAPAEAAFTMTNKTAFYRVQIQYIDGTSTTVVSPL